MSDPGPYLLDELIEQFQKRERGFRALLAKQLSHEDMIEVSAQLHETEHFVDRLQDLRAKL